MPEVDKAVAPAWLLGLCGITRNSQIVEPIAVILREISCNFRGTIATGHVFHHQVGPSLLVSGDPLYVNRTTVVLLTAAARSETLSGFLLLQRHVVLGTLGVPSVATVLAATTLAANSPQQVRCLATWQVVLDLLGTTLGYPLKAWSEGIVRPHFSWYTTVHENLRIVDRERVSRAHTTGHGVQSRCSIIKSVPSRVKRPRAARSHRGLST